jgi:hypothetical protein
MMRIPILGLVGRMIPALAIAMLALPGAAAAQDATSEAPAAKVAVGGCLAGGADCLETATLIEPDATVTDPTPHSWESVSVASDGMTLSVYFWMGVPECNGLNSVEVTPTETGIDIVLLTGVPAGAEDNVCIAIAQLYRTDVVLDQTLIGGAFPE